MKGALLRLLPLVVLLAAIGQARSWRVDTGTPVALAPDLGGLQRGDLVFWKGHVGIMLDAQRLIHANGYTMMTSVEPLAVAEERIRTKSYGPITSIRRLPALGA